MEKSGLTILRPNAFRYFCSLLSNSLLEFVFKVIIFLSHNQLKYCNPDVVKLSLSTIIQDFSKLFKQASLFQYCFHNFIIKSLIRCILKFNTSFYFLLASLFPINPIIFGIKFSQTLSKSIHSLENLYFLGRLYKSQLSISQKNGKWFVYQSNFSNQQFF